MARARAVDPCMFCGELPCVCNAKVVKPRALKSPGKPSKLDEKKRMQERAKARKAVPVVEAVKAEPVKHVRIELDETVLAIRTLSVAGMLHPDEMRKHGTIGDFSGVSEVHGEVVREGAGGGREGTGSDISQGQLAGPDIKHGQVEGNANLGGNTRGHEEGMGGGGDTSSRKPDTTTTESTCITDDTSIQLGGDHSTSGRPSVRAAAWRNKRLHTSVWGGGSHAR